MRPWRKLYRVQTKVAIKRSLQLYLVSKASINSNRNHSNSPDQGSEASDGGKHVTTRLEEDHVTLLDKVALLVACLAVKQAAVVEAAVDPDIEFELGALGSHGGKGCKPEDHHDTVKDDDGNDMIEFVQSGQLLT